MPDDVVLLCCAVPVGASASHSNIIRDHRVGNSYRMNEQRGRIVVKTKRSVLPEQLQMSGFINGTKIGGRPRRLLKGAWALFSLAATCNAFSAPRDWTARLSPRVSYATSTATESAISVAATSEMVEQDTIGECPRGFYLDSVNQRCSKLGPLGTASQAIELVGPFQAVSRKISTLCGIDPTKISNLGVTFALSYAAISNINGSISLSVAWYMACSKTGLSPLAPGQWKSLLKAYATIYAFVQVLRPFRVAAAVAMSKLSSEFLDQTQDRLECSRRIAILFQYGLGWVAWLVVASIGISLASWSSSVPIWAGAV